MSTKHSGSQEPDPTTTDPPVKHPHTQQTPLGVDRNGKHHIFAESRAKIIVLDSTGIEHEFALAEIQREAPELTPESSERETLRYYMAHVRQRRGWMKEQYLALTFGDLGFGGDA